VSKKATTDVVQILSRPLFNEPMRVETVRRDGDGAVVAELVGIKSERFRSVRLTSKDLHNLTILETAASFDGDGKLLRPGLQA
jgi:hypothetical protein